MENYQADWISKWAVYSPRKIAVKEYESQRTLSYLQLDRLGNRLSHYLRQNCGVVKGDRVALLMENCLEHIVLFAAAQKLGCILVPFNVRLAAPEINYLIEDAEPRLIIYAEAFKKLLERRPVSKRPESRLSFAKLSEICNPHTTEPEDLSAPLNSIKEEDPIFILYTSGTTGFPKGAVYTHKMLLWNSINTALSLLVNTQSRTINCMPLFHTGGWNVLLSPFLHRGAYVCLMKKFDPVIVLELLESERPSIFMGVPTMLRMIADLPDFSKTDLSSLHYIIVGGEAMPIPLIERWHQRGVPIRQGYGMTEVGPNLTSLHQDDAIRKKGSIGRPNFYVQTKIVKSDGQTARANQEGELWLKGPMVTPAYWQNETATRQAITDGWFHTGDIVREDEEGFLYIADRLKNMYISGGENVYPAEIERVLLSHPAVSEAAVIGAPDPKWGEVGKAFIVLKSDRKIGEEALIRHCREKLARFKIPKRFLFLAALPKNETGKIDREALKKG